MKTPAFPLRTSALVMATALLLVACGEKAPPCVICYEDEWSREPFPGQAKQHLPALTPDQVKSGSPVSTREFLGESQREQPY
ncbi:MAG: hypothetical protein DI628_05390 [Blastochloris viridis]|uniref:Uncharacterized protein n=1 Tax=Blastochloris viridis TaxID=1079 RepID=A0A6N4R6A3_BLAVI|nr:MAG: hypothetical protein DI628_05390 [Blastochloris viridis]